MMGVASFSPDPPPVTTRILPSIGNFQDMIYVDNLDLESSSPRRMRENEYAHNFKEEVCGVDK